MQGFIKFLVGLVINFFKSLGRQELIREQRDKTDALEKHWSEIDSDKRDFNGSLINLRKRSDRALSNPPPSKRRNNR